ncbi:UDP-N-acetylmuramoyl-L-alanine--D-glutamate ligase [Desulfocurvus sp. DL9XJH121]
MKNSTVAVVGAGTSGRSAARLAVDRGAKVRLLERSQTPPAEAAELEPLGVELLLGEHSPEQFAGADMVILSPGVPLARIKALLPAAGGPEVISEMELGYRFARGRILAVTGTNGKTTSSGLAAHILRREGHSVFLGGNIGTPLCEHVLSGEAADVLVLEVSSFQAQACTTFRPEVGVLLNFAPDHQDHHASMEEYLRAKLNMFANMHSEDLAVLPAAMRDKLEDYYFTRARIHWFESTDRFESECLPGAHNQSNMEAVFQAVKRFGITERGMRESLDGFEPYPHRLELVGERRGVRFINDSKATTVDALAAALETFDAPVLLLAGGVYKGGDLAALAPLIRRKVKAVCLFGDSREIFEKAWAGHVPLAWEPALEKAVHRLMTWAEQGDVMLLSPATASFDLYKNYKQRGLDFRRIFEELGE